MKGAPLIVRPTTCLAPRCKRKLKPALLGRPRLTCCEACKKRLQRKQAREARSNSVEWYTPLDVFEWFSERWGPFDLDPFSAPLSPVWPLVEHHLVRADDALVSPWRGRRAYANPPFGRVPGLGPCTERGRRAVLDGEVELAAYLVPLRPSSAWCRTALEAGAELAPYPKRIRFVELTAAGELVRTSGALFECTALVFRDTALSRNSEAA